MKTILKASGWAVVLSMALAIGWALYIPAPAELADDQVTAEGDPRRFGPLLGGYVLPEAEASADSVDRCYGKLCRVQSLTIPLSAGTASGFIKMGNGLKIYTAVGDSNWIYSNGFRPSSLYSDSTIASTGSIAAGTTLSAGSTVGATTYLFSAGAVLSGACPLNGALEWDTTALCYKTCSTNWSGCLLASASTSTGISISWSAYCEKANCTKTEAASDAFLMPMRDIAGTVARVSCNWRTAGSGTGNVVVAIWNETDSSELCSCTLGLCTTASGVSQICSCAGTLASGKFYVMRLKSTTNCATTIPGLIGCTATISQ